MDNSRVTARSTEPFLFMGIARRKRTCHSLVVVFVYSFIFHRFIFLVVVVAVVLLQFSRYAFLIICFWLYHEKKIIQNGISERTKKIERARNNNNKNETTCSRLLGLNIFSASQCVSHTHAACTLHTGRRYGVSIRRCLTEAHTASKSA